MIPKFADFHPTPPFFFFKLMSAFDTFIDVRKAGGRSGGELGFRGKIKSSHL